MPYKYIVRKSPSKVYCFKNHKGGIVSQKSAIILFTGREHEHKETRICPRLRGFRTEPKKEVKSSETTEFSGYTLGIYTNIYF